MKTVPPDYKKRPDGLYEKTCVFMTGDRVHCRETLVRNKRGVLIKVENAGRVRRQLMQS